MKQKDYLWLLGAVIMIIFFMNYRTSIDYTTSTNNQPQPYSGEDNPDWLQAYQEGLPQEYSIYLEETALFDYSSPEIQAISNKIIQESSSVEEAVGYVLDYVYFNVKYNWHEPDSLCFSSKASDIIKRKTGQCDTMSRADIAILRGIGIAAKPEGGCLAMDNQCLTGFAVIGDARIPKVGDIIEEGGSASRGGGLHEWLEVYLPSKGGWVDAEATAGRLIEEGSCIKLVHELYPVNVFQECISISADFIAMCKTL